MIIGTKGRKIKHRGNGAKLRYVNEFRDRFGNVRRYFRRPGHSAIVLPDGDKGSPEFLAAYLDAMTATGTRTEIGVQRTLAGTVNAAITGYYRSALFTANLAEGTQRSRRGILERFREAYGDRPIGKLDRPFMAALLAKAPASSARNHLVAFRGLMKYALQAGLIKADPTEGIEAAKPPSKTADDPDAEDGHLTWPERWIDQFEAHWPVGSKPRLVFGLALHTAQRRSDLVRMGPGQVKNGMIKLRQQKTKTPVSIPIVPELAENIAASVCGIKTYIVNDWGKPFAGAASGLGTAFRRWCDAAGLPKEAVIHGLRKAWCRRAAERGLTEDEMMKITGHKTSKELRRYLAAIDGEAVALRAMAKMVA
jgi:integrase